MKSGYFFKPPFCKTATLSVWENCFGTDAGMTHVVPVWESGRIYRCGGVELSQRDGRLIVSAKPDNDSFWYFGVSPNVCLSGHRHHFGDFDFLTAELSADRDVEFLGIAFRLSCGDVVRAIPLTSDGTDRVTVSSQPRRYAVRLTQCLRGDSSAAEFTVKMRNSIAEAEFLFKCGQRCSVTVFDPSFTDTGLAAEGRAKDETADGSMILPC